jgi:PAS domain S-box-containing protein
MASGGPERKLPSPAALWARLSLALRVMLGTSLALVFASSLLLWVSTAKEAEYARMLLDEHRASEIDSLLPAITDWAVIGDFASIERFFKQRVSQSDIRSISWMSANGKSLQAVDKDDVLRAPGWFVGWTSVLSTGVSRTLSIGGRNYGQVTLEMTATPAQNRLWNRFLGSLAILALALVLSIAVILVVLRRGLRPLSALTQGANSLADGDYSRRIPRRGSPEMVSLIDAFNHMTVGIATAQGAVRDEAERLSVTLTSIGDAVIATDADGCVEFMNPVAEAMTGWTAAEAEGMALSGVFVIVGETTRKPVACPVARAIRETRVVGLANHTVLISRDGRERPIADSAAPIRAADGAILGAVLVFRDQGPERAAARTLRESEAAYRGLFDGIGEAVYVQDVEGRFLDVNGAAERMYGIPRAEFIGKTPDFIAAPGKNDLTAISRIIARAFAGEPQRFEFWGRRANGEVFPKEVRLVRGNYRNQDVIIASSDDITERKLAESRLLKAQEMIRSSVAAARVFPWEWDVATDRLVWGVSPEALLGLPRVAGSGYPDFRELVHPDDKEVYLAAGRHTLATGEPYQCEFRITATDGPVRWVAARGEAIRGPDGKVVRMIGASLDISEQKRLTEEIEHHREHLEVLVAERTSELTAARAEAERMARVKSEFLANMSHELRTPLNGVLGMARIGARDSVGRASHDVFVRIMDSGRHLLGVINDILDFSKIDAGKLVVEQRPFALAAAIDNAVGFVIGTAEQKGLHFELTVAADLPAWVTGDSQRLQQVLVNLLSNAIKFTPRGEVRLRVARDGHFTYFRVIDTGVGMSAEQVARLFQPFEQGDSSTTRRYGGTGLGLAISQNLARLMGGEIDVDCTPGAGCSFTLHLPLPVAASDLAPAASRIEGDRRLEGLRLLAAEDVEVNRLILEDLLSHEGARVVFAEDGQQVIDRLREEGVAAFDAVLMDVQMPVMNGFESTRRVREMAPALPVIGLTAHALAEERERCLAAGMVEHVSKPIDPDELVAVILRFVGPGDRFPPGPTLKASELRHFAGPNPAGLVDWPALMAQYGGREDFVTKLATMAVTGQRDVPAKLRNAVTQGDLDALAFVAHSLKAIGGNLKAHGVKELAARTESAAKAREPQAAALAAELADLFDALLAELSQRLSDTGPTAP